MWTRASSLLAILTAFLLAPHAGAQDLDKRPVADLGSLTENATEVYGAVPAGTPTLASFAAPHVAPASAHSSSTVLVSKSSKEVTSTAAKAAPTADATHFPTPALSPGTLSMQAAATPALKPQVLYWAEPITPPGGVAPLVAPNEMTLVEVQGSVSVQFPGGATLRGFEGMVLPSGSTITTSTASSAAIFVGGIDSVRLIPETTAKVDHDLTGSLRRTLISLRQGTTFSRVGHRAGETQDFEVKTSEGIAAATGTEFADTVANGHHYVFVVKGVVKLLAGGGLVGTLAPTAGNLASGSMPHATDNDAVFLAALSGLQPFQAKLNAVISHMNAGLATPSEIGFFNLVKSTYFVVQKDAHQPTLLSGI